MFQFPGFAPTPYVFRCRYRASTVGCPIRKFPDQSLFVSSPRLIADYYVLSYYLKLSDYIYTAVFKTLRLQ